MEKRLYRIKNNQTMLGGVSQGLGEYFNIDPVLFRFLFVILFCTPFPSFFIYFILWIFLPEKSGYLATNNANFQISNISDMSNQSKNGNLVGGTILIILGVIFSIQQLTDYDVWEWIGKLWPLGLIAIGVWMIVRDRDGGSNNKNYTNDNT